MADIILYPSNWLYNAGVVGFLNCLERNDYLIEYNGSKFTLVDNYVKLNNQFFQNINIEENYFENGKIINLKGKNAYYPNFIDTTGNQKWVFIEFVKQFSGTNTSEICSLCPNPIYINKSIIEPQENTNQNLDQINKFFSKIETLNMIHNKLLGPSDKFPNAHWNLNDKFKICHLCTFILIHHHLSLTKLSDGSEIFINAPSFKIMYEMNRLVKELFGKEDTPGKQKRELLAMSVIEYSRRLNVSLGMWNMMNLEIIVKSRDGIDSFSLPYETVNLISDRKIASLLSEIGEFSILNLILNKEEDKLIDIGHKLIRIGIKSYQDRNKSDNAIVNSFLHKGSNKTNIINTAQKILELYANITERRNDKKVKNSCGSSKKLFIDEI